MADGSQAWFGARLMGTGRWRPLASEWIRHSWSVLEPIAYSVPLALWVGYLSRELDSGEGWWRSVRTLGLRNVLLVGTLVVIVTMEIIRARRDERKKRSAAAARSAHRPTAGELKVSIHHADQANDLVLGSACFDRIVVNIRRARRAGVRCAINTVVNRSNRTELPDLAWLAHELGCHKITFIPFVPRGRGSEPSERAVRTDRGRDRGGAPGHQKARNGAGRIRRRPLYRSPVHALLDR